MGLELEKVSGIRIEVPRIRIDSLELELALKTLLPIHLPLMVTTRQKLDSKNVHCLCLMKTLDFGSYSNVFHFHHSHN